MSVAVQCKGFDCPTFVGRPSGEGIDQESSKRIVRTIKEEISKWWVSETITFGRALDEGYSSLIMMYQECSEADWDGYGASPLTEAGYIEARKIINLLPSSIPMPAIFPEPTGEIGFEWRRGSEQVFVINVGGKHQITYAGIFGANKIHGSEYFDETLPLVMIQLLRRLFS